MEFGMGIGADTLSIEDLLDFSNQENIFAPITGPHHPAQFATSFADIYIPSEDAAELEWLSNFVEESFSAVPYPAAYIPVQAGAEPAASTSSTSSDFPTSRKRNVDAVEESGVVRRCCTHCASEKTPQWRTGPLGPKTLCNACGVRYKSGRLVPEYRPASSPTFVLAQHSNSHRKVMELRRQKEVHHQRQSNGSVAYHDRLISLS